MLHRQSKMIAYLLLAHADTAQLGWLMRTLLSDPRSSIFLHFDARVPLPDWIGAMARAGRIALVRRIAVNWAGYSQVVAFRELLVAALADPETRRFTLLSGSCYPVRRMVEVNDAIAAREGAFALWKRVSPPDAGVTSREENATGKLHFMDVAWLNPQRGKIRRQLWKGWDLVNARLPYRRRVDGPVVKGSTWFCTDRAGATRLVAESGPLEPAFRRSKSPDEHVFQTIWYRDRVRAGRPVQFVNEHDPVQALHYIPFRPPSGRTLLEKARTTIDPRLMRLDDIAVARGTDALFARKCPPEVARALLDIQDAPLGDGADR